MFFNCHKGIDANWKNMKTMLKKISISTNLFAGKTIPF